MERCRRADPKNSFFFFLLFLFLKKKTNTREEEREKLAFKVGKPLAVSLSFSVVDDVGDGDPSRCVGVCVTNCGKRERERED